MGDSQHRVGDPLMYGLTGCVGSARTTRRFLAGLWNLEHRGYDSAGMALTDGDGLDVLKREGEVDRPASVLERDSPEGRSASDTLAGTPTARRVTRTPARTPAVTGTSPSSTTVSSRTTTPPGPIDRRGTRLRERDRRRCPTPLVGKAMADGADPDGAFRRAAARARRRRGRELPYE